MGKVAFVFPGQASQYPGMGKELAEMYPSAKAVFEALPTARLKPRPYERFFSSTRMLLQRERFPERLFQ